jgi:hypothetical protein
MFCSLAKIPKIFPYLFNHKKHWTTTSDKSFFQSWRNLENNALSSFLQLLRNRLASVCVRGRVLTCKIFNSSPIQFQIFEILIITDKRHRRYLPPIVVFKHQTRVEQRCDFSTVAKCSFADFHKNVLAALDRAWLFTNLSRKWIFFARLANREICIAKRGHL